MKDLTLALNIHRLVTVKDFECAKMTPTAQPKDTMSFGPSCCVPMDQHLFG